MTQSEFGCAQVGKSATLNTNKAPNALLQAKIPLSHEVATTQTKLGDFILPKMVHLSPHFVKTWLKVGQRKGEHTWVVTRNMFILHN